MSVTLRQAILSAADHIESHPETFDFPETCVPHDCGSPGCALGWIAFAVGRRSGSCHTAVEDIGLGVDHFYETMNALNSQFEQRTGDCSNWMDEATLCATLMREYAEKHYPVQS